MQERNQHIYKLRLDLGAIKITRCCYKMVHQNRLMNTVIQWLRWKMAWLLTHNRHHTNHHMSYRVCVVSILDRAESIIMTPAFIYANHKCQKWNWTIHHTNDCRHNMWAITWLVHGIRFSFIWCHAGHMTLEYMLLQFSHHISFIKRTLF